MTKKLPKVLFLLIIGICVSATLLTGEVTANEVNKVGIKVMEKELLGKFLSDGKGMSLYSFSRDTKNVSNCIEGCAANWPPFFVDESAVIEGCESSDFTTIKRSDRRLQTTYKGMPLYYFINDKYPNDTFGHGLGDAWYLVTP